MKNDHSLFQKYCEKAIGKLSDSCINEFKLTKDEESRIKLMYDYARNIPINLKGNGKHLEAAQEEKEKGNKLFAKKDYKNAMQSYNNGIIKCPQDSDAGRELLTILISNRSATLFELKEYKRVFNDIDYLMEIGNYPSHLQYKIWIRKAKCYAALQNEKSSSEAYDKALECLTHSKLDEKTLLDKITEIKNLRTTKNAPIALLNNELVPFFNADIFTGGKEYISAHPKICIDQDTVQGRYARATEDIEAGLIILEENPHGAVIGRENALLNCQYCVSSTDQPIACPSCAYAVFCNTNCERLACKTFHKTECLIQQAIYESGASINCFLAMRLISQKQLQFFEGKKKALRDFLKDSCKKNIIKKKQYRFDDYDNVFFLCRNEQLRKKEELIHFSCMAIYLLRLLKFANYFGDKVKDDVLSENELFIGSLILRHLQILQFNAHEISQLQTVKESTIIEAMQTNYENKSIGAAVYPTLALFNHSCDPSIVRYNVKNTIVVRTIKPVKAGDIIYENYGPLYMAISAEKRQETLKNQYWFECLCSPCVELWPTFDEMNDNELRIPCKTSKCPFVFTVNPNDDDPFLTCDYCKNVTSLFPYLKGLMALEGILASAEYHYGLGQLDNALKNYLQALSILFKYSKPPHRDIIKIQQRVRVCMVHFGNKACGYQFKA